MRSTVLVRIKSDLVKQAGAAGAPVSRTSAAQIEHWARLGRILDTVLSNSSVTNVKELARAPQLDRVVVLSQTKAGRTSTGDHRAPPQLDQ